MRTGGLIEGDRVKDETCASSHPARRRLLIYSFFFGLGIGYIMALFANLEMVQDHYCSHPSRVGSAVLGLVAWSRYPGMIRMLHICTLVL